MVIVSESRLSENGLEGLKLAIKKTLSVENEALLTCNFTS